MLLAIKGRNIFRGTTFIPYISVWYIRLFKLQGSWATFEKFFSRKSFSQGSPSLMGSFFSYSSHSSPYIRLWSKYRAFQWIGQEFCGCDELFMPFFVFKKRQLCSFIPWAKKALWIFLLFLVCHFWSRHFCPGIFYLQCRILSSYPFFLCRLPW